MSVNKSFDARLKACHSLEELLEVLEISSWDYLIVGDGSGTTWERTCGWGSTLIENHTFARTPFWGGFSRGSNNVAEMMAFLHPLLYLAGRAEQLDTGIRVYVVTDSNLVARCGNGDHGRHANQELWYMLDACKRKGILTEFRWIPRDCVDLNRFADKLAGTSRLAVQDLDMNTQASMNRSLFTLNPQQEKETDDSNP